MLRSRCPMAFSCPPLPRSTKRACSPASLPSTPALIARSAHHSPTPPGHYLSTRLGQGPCTTPSYFTTLISTVFIAHSITNFRSTQVTSKQPFAPPIVGNWTCLTLFKITLISPFNSLPWCRRSASGPATAEVKTSKILQIALHRADRRHRDIPRISSKKHKHGAFYEPFLVPTVGTGNSNSNDQKLVRPSYSILQFPPSAPKHAPGFATNT
jgi:hypothetical protein